VDKTVGDKSTSMMRIFPKLFLGSLIFAVLSTILDVKVGIKLIYGKIIALLIYKNSLYIV